MKLGKIENISGIKLGILGTHLGVLEALVPNEEGLLPRDKDGEFVVVSGTKKLLELSPVRVDLIQLLSFGNMNKPCVKALWKFIMHVKTNFCTAKRPVINNQIITMPKRS